MPTTARATPRKRTAATAAVKEAPTATVTEIVAAPEAAPETTPETVAEVTPVASTTGRQRGSRPEIEKMLDDRGVFYDYYDEFDLELIDLPKSRHNQARNVVLNDNQVEAYKEAMERGDAFPAVVLFPENNGKYVVVDGNHRVTAALAANYPIGAYVLNKKTSRGTVVILTYEANTRHGLPTSPEERASHAVYLIENAQETIKAAAARMNLPVSVLQKYYTLHKIDNRAARLRIPPSHWDDIVQTSRIRLNTLAADEVFLAAVEMSYKARLSSVEIDDMLTQVKVHGAAGDQLAVIQQWLEDNRERISGVATGEVRPKRSSGGGPRWALRSSIFMIESLKEEAKLDQMVVTMNPLEIGDWVRRIDDAVKTFKTVQEALRKRQKEA